MNVYDFDGTIYDGDSTLDFYFFCVFTHIQVIRALPAQLRGCFFYFVKIIDKTAFKEYFYSFLNYLNKPEDDVRRFWMHHKRKIKRWYLNQLKPNDIIVSASPEFLLYPVHTELKIGGLIASKVDIYSGKCMGPNCRGIEKAKRFREIYGDVIIDKFYSDNESDYPMAQLARKSYLLKRGKVIEWRQNNNHFYSP